MILSPHTQPDLPATPEESFPAVSPVEETSPSRPGRSGIRRLVVMVLFFIVGGGAGLLYLKLIPPVYLAESTLSVIDLSPARNGGENATGENLADTPRLLSLESHVELLSDTDLQQTAMAQLPGAIRRKGFRRGHTLGVITVHMKPNSSLITIAARARTGPAAAQLANKLGETYIDTDTRAQRDAAARMRAYAEIERGKAQQRFLQANAELAEYKSKSGLIAPKEQLVQFAARVSGVQAEHRQMRADVAAHEQALRVLTGELNQMNVQLSNSESFRRDPRVAEALRRIDELTKARAQLLEAESENAPEVQGITAQLADAERELQQFAREEMQQTTAVTARGPALENYYATLVTLVISDVKSKALEKELAALQAEQKKLPGEEARFSELMLALELQKNALAQIDARFHALALREQMAGATIRVLSRAAVPTRPIAPRPTRVLPIFLLIGAVIGLLITLLLERVNHRTTTQHDEGLEENPSPEFVRE